MGIILAGSGFHKAGDGDDLAGLYPAKMLRRMPPCIRTGLRAATRALEKSGRFPCPEDTALVIGTWHGCQGTSFDFMDSIIRDGPSLASPLAFSHSVNNVAAGLIGMCLGLRGTAMTINNQGQSFAAAVQAAHTLILGGMASRVLAGCMEDFDSRILSVFPDLAVNASSYFIFLEADDS